MTRWILAAMLALGLAGLCSCATEPDYGYRDQPGHHWNGNAGRSVECRQGNCERYFREVCHGAYDEVRPEHFRDYHVDGHDHVRIAVCHD